jgi:predicted nucleic acid-binding protein
MPRRLLVLDANILIRAVLGQRVRRILEAHVDDIGLYIPEAAYAEAEEHLAALAVQRGGDPGKALAALRVMAELATVAGLELYSAFETEARKRLGARDPEDWPVLAAALALECPLWTEDTDFFGCGVATWTSAGIEIFLDQQCTSGHRATLLRLLLICGCALPPPMTGHLRA